MARSTDAPRAPARAGSSATRGRAPAKTARPSAAPSAHPPRRAAPASKISITVDSAVLHEVKRLIRDTGLSLSAHVTQALERDLRRRRMQQILDEYEEKNGTITEEELAEVRAAWRA